MASSRSSAPRLRRRPQPNVWQSAWRHRACRIGFIAGFVAGIVFVAGLSRSATGSFAEAVAAAPAPASAHR